MNLIKIFQNHNELIFVILSIQKKGEKYLRIDGKKSILESIKNMGIFLNFFLKPILTKISGLKPVTTILAGFFHTEKRVILLTKVILKKDRIAYKE